MHFSTHHLFSEQKITSFVHFALMPDTGSDHTSYFILEKKTDYTVYTDYKKQTEFLFILISPIYSQSGSVMNEQCVWRQIELDTTPVLEQGTNQYF